MSGVTSGCQLRIVLSTALGLIALCVSGAVAGQSQISPTDRAAITNYQTLLKSAESGTPRRLEAAYEVLLELEPRLTKVLESLTDTQFEQLKRDLPGADVSREEILYVRPIPEYFEKLAAAHGDETDGRFFSALYSTRGIVSPIYMDSVTDYSQCAAFGNGKMVETYRLWTQFQHDFPRRYVASVRGEVQEVSEAFLSTCPCGELSTIQRELEQFLQTFPTSPIRTEVEARLNVIRAGTSGIKPNCHPG